MNLINNQKNIGILFHHFNQNKKYYDSPGSLDKNKFFKFIKKYKDLITRPEKFLKETNNKKICLTFDDGLKCQYDIALPILEEFKIKSFFFVFTYPHEKTDLTIETIRYFRYKYFLNQKLFYKTLFRNIEDVKSVKLNKLNLFNEKIISHYKKHSPYYNLLDIKFKILRDNFLTNLEYNQIIASMIKQKKIDLKKLNKKLYMSKKEIKKISDLNHMVGLHSHYHNHKIHEHSYMQEFKDYKKNKLILEKIIKKKIITCSYPFGNFTINSEKILKKLKIKYAFCKNNKTKLINKKEKNLYLPRQNISNIKF